MWWPWKRRPVWVDLVQDDDITRWVRELAAWRQADAKAQQVRRAALVDSTQPLPQLGSPLLMLGQRWRADGGGR